MKSNLLRALLLCLSIVVTSCSEPSESPEPVDADSFLINVGTAPIVLDDLSIDASSNVLVLGNTAWEKDVTISLGRHNLLTKGRGDGFLAKYDSYGKPLWGKIIGSTQQDEANVVATDHAGNVYVAGFFRTETNLDGVQLTIDDLTGSGGRPNMLDMFLVKYDKDGNQQWVKKISGVGSERPTAIQVDMSGRIYITGYFQGNINFGNGIIPYYDHGSAFFIASYAPNGNLIWGKTYAGGETSVYPSFMKLNSQGNIIILGTFEGTKNIDGQTIHTAGERDVFISEFTDAGNLIWVKSFGGEDADLGSGLAVDSDDNIYVGCLAESSFTMGGHTFDSKGTDGFLIKFSNTADVKWVQQISGFGANSIMDVEAINGQVLVNGYFEKDVLIGDTTLTSNTYGHTGFVANFSVDGKFKSALTIGSSLYGPSRIAINSFNHVFIASTFSMPFTFGSTHIKPYGVGSIFLAKHRFSN